jgi:hypothetical protein
MLAADRSRQQGDGSELKIPIKALTDAARDESQTFMRMAQGGANPTVNPNTPF